MGKAGQKRVANVIHLAINGFRGNFWKLYKKLPRENCGSMSSTDCSS